MIELSNNYQPFAPAFGKVNDKGARPMPRGVDAIFLPFKHRIDHVNSLIHEIQWYQGPIYLMPSNNTDVISIIRSHDNNIQALTVKESNFVTFYRALRTSSHRKTDAHIPSWDLPIKRNYAIWYAKKRGFQKILLIDDDIRKVTPFLFAAATQALEGNAICGCFVENFPDTSVHGHLELLSGTSLKPFLSGSILFVNVEKIYTFFPQIYNEDWLFMIDYVRSNAAVSLGSIAQLPYDPFANVTTVRFQEFGEIIVEGLFALLRSGNYQFRYDPNAWEDIIQERRKSCDTLIQHFENPVQQKVIAALLDENAKVTPDDCVGFIRDWEHDIQNWKYYLSGRQDEQNYKIENC